MYCDHDPHFNCSAHRHLFHTWATLTISKGTSACGSAGGTQNVSGVELKWPDSLLELSVQKVNN